jgi:hypothetical protein
MGGSASARSWRSNAPKGSGRGCLVDSPQEWPVPRKELRRRQRAALFTNERAFWEEGVSEFVYDEEREVFPDAEGRVVLSRHYADRRLLGS